MWVCVCVCGHTRAAAVLAVLQQGWWYKSSLCWTTEGSRLPPSQRWCHKSSLGHWDANTRTLIKKKIKHIHIKGPVFHDCTGEHRYICFMGLKMTFSLSLLLTPFHHTARLSFPVLFSMASIYHLSAWIHANAAYLKCCCDMSFACSLQNVKSAKQCLKNMQDALSHCHCENFILLTLISDLIRVLVFSKRLPEWSTVLWRSVSHYGKDGRQHTQEKHKKQHGQVEIVGSKMKNGKTMRRGIQY